MTVTYHTVAQFDTCTRDAGIDVTTNPGHIQLAPVEYIVEDTGDKLGSAGGGASWGKKIFVLDKPAAAGARLFTFRSPGAATFNGTPITFKALDYAAWVVADIPGNLLQDGDNELVMQSCAVPIDVQANAENSFVSANKGGTWQPVPGEFLAHLRLNQYPAKGVITSGVIDLANPEGKNIICPAIDVHKVTIGGGGAVGTVGANPALGNNNDFSCEIRTGPRPGRITHGPTGRRKISTPRGMCSGAPR